MTEEKKGNYKGIKMDQALKALKALNVSSQPEGMTIEGVKLYNFDEAAQVMGMSRRTVQNYYYANKLTGRKLGRKIYILAESIAEYLRTGKG